jgi:S-layer homology domain
MRRYCVALIVLVVAAMATASLAQAQMVAWNGAEMDASQVPADVPATTEVASGQIPEGPPPMDPKWGIQDYVTYTVGVADYVRRWGCSSNGTPSISNLDILRPSSDTGLCVGYPVHLPTGAHLEYVRVMMYDDTTSTTPSMGMFENYMYGPRTTIVALTPSASSAGNRYVDFAVDYTVPNKNTSLLVLAILNQSGALYEGLYGLTFWMHLQISPAPATATFVDVPVGSFGFRQIEALASSGITAGCDATHFCPNSPISRAQMAVFLAKALGLHWDI